MNRQLETLKLRAKIQEWQINKIVKTEKEKRNKYINVTYLDGV